MFLRRFVYVRKLQNKKIISGMHVSKYHQILDLKRNFILRFFPFHIAFILDGKQFMGSPWEMYLINGYLARMKSGFVYGYASNLYLFPDLKLGEFTFLCFMDLID